MSDETKTTNETPAPRANLNIPETFVVEDGLPDLPAGGRTGQSKYNNLLAQAKALKVNQKIRIPCGPVPTSAFTRNLRLAMKKGNLTGVRVTACVGKDEIADAPSVWVYRNA